MVVWVAPLVGAWIEIAQAYVDVPCGCVAPLVGAWIEIKLSIKITLPLLSLLSWERGLKLYNRVLNNFVPCRSSRGSVD